MLLANSPSRGPTVTGASHPAPAGGLASGGRNPNSPGGGVCQRDPDATQRIKALPDNLLNRPMGAARATFCAYTTWILQRAHGPTRMGSGLATHREGRPLPPPGQARPGAPPPHPSGSEAKAICAIAKQGESSHSGISMPIIPHAWGLAKRGLRTTIQNEVPRVTSPGHRIPFSSAASPRTGCLAPEMMLQFYQASSLHRRAGEARDRFHAGKTATSPDGRHRARWQHELIPPSPPLVLPSLLRRR